MYMYMYMYIYMYMYMYMYTYIYYVYDCVCACVRMWVCLFVQDAEAVLAIAPRKPNWAWGPDSCLLGPCED